MPEIYLLSIDYRRLHKRNRPGAEDKIFKTETPVVGLDKITTIQVGGCITYYTVKKIFLSFSHGLALDFYYAVIQ